MPTIAEQLQQIASIKANIKAAIEAKGETVGSDAFATYPTHIANISGGGEDTLNAFFLNTLTELVVPEGVTSLPAGFAQNKTSLTSARFPNTLTTIPQNVLNGCTNMASITLGNAVTKIENNALMATKYITSIDFPDTITTMGGSVLSGCSRLTSVKFPPLLAAISNQVCYSCGALKTVDIGANVTSIGTNTFSYCSACTTIICRATTPPTVTSSTFGNGGSLYTGRATYSQGVNKLYVPQGCSAAYNTSYWASVLLDATKCGFTIAELDANGNIPT